MTNNQRQGNVFMIAGPSGVGKGTVVKRILELDPQIKISVSATTRSPRPNEIPGVSYHYMTQQQFDELIQNDGFLEYASYVGNSYGTPKDFVIESTKNGFDVILEIEVEGCKQVMQKLPEAKGFFILPPSYEVLEDRLRNRGSETEDKIQKRLNKARTEISEAYRFDYFVVNDTVEQAAQNILDTIKKHR